MLNHAPPTDVNAKFYHDSDNIVSVQCLRDISPGEQVGNFKNLDYASGLKLKFYVLWFLSFQIFISYDDRPDDQLLIDYGFCLGPGENSKSCLNFETDEVLAAARKIFDAEGKELSSEFRFSLENERRNLRIFENNIGYEIDHFIECLVRCQFDEDVDLKNILVLKRKVRQFQILLKFNPIESYHNFN